MYKRRKKYTEETTLKNKINKWRKTNESKHILAVENETKHSNPRHPLEKREPKLTVTSRKLDTHFSFCSDKTQRDQETSPRQAGGGGVRLGEAGQGGSERVGMGRGSTDHPGLQHVLSGTGEAGEASLSLPDKEREV